MPYFLIIIILLGCLILLSNPFIVLFHELGHAIPAILLTKQKVTVYIGSYGDPNKSLKINFGALVIFFRYNPFNWRMGLCMPSAKTISINKQIIYTLTGPLTSFFIASIACYFTFSHDLHGFLKLFFIVFLGTAFFDLLNNLIPSETPIKLYDGTFTYNDGYNLKQLFYNKRLPKDYFEAVDLYNEQRFADAAILFATILSERVKDENLYRLTISCYLQDKNYEKSKEVLEAFALSFKMQDINRSFELEPDNSYGYMNIGIYHFDKGEFDKALQQFLKAKELDSKTYMIDKLISDAKCEIDKRPASQ